MEYKNSLLVLSLFSIKGSSSDYTSWTNKTILSVNTNGIKKNGHLAIQHTFSKYALCCLQETRFRDRQHLETFRFHLISTFSAKSFVSDTNSLHSHPSRERVNGVMTIIRSDFPGFETAEAVQSVTVQDRYLVVRLVVHGAPVYVHNVYAPVDSTERKPFFDQLPTGSFEANASHIVCGDLNTTLCPSLDCSSGAYRHEPSRLSCLEWLSNLGVLDAWRHQHPEERIFTGPQPRRNRLDYILLSENLFRTIYKDSNYASLPHTGDHLAHVLKFANPCQLQGRGYWKCPLSLFEYPVIIGAIEVEADRILEKLRASSHPGKDWERWKKSMKHLLQQIQKKIRRQEEDELVNAQSELEHAASAYRMSNQDSEKKIYMEALHSYHERVKSSSKYNQDSVFDHHMKNMEKSSRYFFRPLDSTCHRVPLEEVLLPTGKVSKNPLDITLQFTDHWGGIMGDKSSSAGVPLRPCNQKQKSLLDTITRTLNSSDESFLSAPLTKSEMEGAIRSMRGHSTPGMDGLPAAFYQLAPRVFGECLQIVFDAQLRRGSLLRSQRSSAITLLYKKGSRADPGNYRPIALICVDVKVLSKVLAYRLQKMLPKLIHDDQKAFLRGRSIHHHIRYMSDLQDLITHRGEEAYATFLDFEKAYDRVDWSYMFAVLSKMNCGNSFIKWTKLLYTNTNVSLLLNGTLSPKITPSRGVKQGDPLSALLFLMTIEPLGNLLRRNEGPGICITPMDTATSLFFADDSTLLSSSLGGVEAQLDVVQLYCDGSGAKLNLSKSTLLPLNRHQVCPPFALVKVLSRCESVKYLGVPFSQSPVNDLMIEFLEDRFYGGFRQWFRRARTVRGRLLVAQTMVLSRLWHFTTHFNIPQHLLRRWQSMLNRFVLSRKYERDSTHMQLIRSELLYLPFSKGGLQVTNIEKQLMKQRLQFLQQFAHHSSTAAPSNWTLTGMEIVKHILPKFGPFKPLDILTISPRRHATMVRWNVASSWWKQTCIWWSQSKWELTPKTLSSQEQYIVMLNAPVWLPVDSHLHFEQRRRSTSAVAHRRCMGMVPEPARTFRMQFAQAFRIRSLRDLFGGRSTWFSSSSEFVLRFSTHTAEHSLEVGKTKLLRRLYVEATQILRRFQPEGVLLCPERFVSEDYLVQFGIQVSDKKVFFPTIPRNQLFRVVGEAKPPDRPHPLLLHIPERDRPSASNWVKDFSKGFKRLRGRLLPIYSDIQLRLTYSILPVRSRFWFLKQAHPDIILCTQKHCGEVESYQHLFFDCSRTYALWEELFPSWTAFFSTRPKWAHIACLRLPPLQDRWKPFRVVLEDVWFALVAIAIHFIWTDRNRRLFDQASSSPTGPAVSVIYSTFSAHIRFFQRQCYDPAQLDQLQTVLLGLLQSGSAKRYFSERSDLLKIRRRGRL